MDLEGAGEIGERTLQRFMNKHGISRKSIIDSSQSWLAHAESLVSMNVSAKSIDLDPNPTVLPFWKSIQSRIGKDPIYFHFAFAC
jgi:hypothetical protein